ncbi:MAG: tetratricopeptide repeat protein [Pirellulales bacterium]|nr:tetratricopeptide repeat protein [Pirellulales bacterium]
MGPSHAYSGGYHGGFSGGGGSIAGPSFHGGNVYHGPSGGGVQGGNFGAFRGGSQHHHLGGSTPGGAGNLGSAFPGGAHYGHRPSTGMPGGSTAPQAFSHRHPVMTSPAGSTAGNQPSAMHHHHGSPGGVAGHAWHHPGSAFTPGQGPGGAGHGPNSHLPGSFVHRHFPAGGTYAHHHHPQSHPPYHSHYPIYRPFYGGLGFGYPYLWYGTGRYPFYPRYRRYLGIYSYLPFLLGGLSGYGACGYASPGLYYAYGLGLGGYYGSYYGSSYGLYGSGTYSPTQSYAVAAVDTSTETPPPEAAPSDDTSSETAPGDAAAADRYELEGEQAFRSGDFEGALRAWRHALVEDQRDLGLVLLLAQGLFAVGQYDEAAASLEFAFAQMDEKHWGVVVENYRELYGNIGDYTKQLRALEKASKDKPGTPVLMLLLGYHYGYLGYPKEAVAVLQKLVVQQPDDLTAQKLFAHFGGKLHDKPATNAEPPAPPATAPAEAAPSQTTPPENKTPDAQSPVTGEQPADNTGSSVDI